jgi:hypothetical protein
MKTEVSNKLIDKIRLKLFNMIHQPLYSAALDVEGNLIHKVFKNMKQFAIKYFRKREKNSMLKNRGYLTLNIKKLLKM